MGMTAKGELTLQDLVFASVNKRLILQGVTWEFYEQLLEEFADSNGLHFAFNDGLLGIEMPLPEHEVPTRILSDLITTVCNELEIDIRNFGMTTFRKRAKAKGCEADVSFYIQNESSVRGRLAIDLTKDPLPDLVIEVDVTSPSLDKFPIYAALGVPEIWLYKNERITFYKLVGNSYKEIKRSLALPVLTSEKATEFLQKGLTERSSTWFRKVREWAKSKK
jgi:Uma2 family endonuclease